MKLFMFILVFISYSKAYTEERKYTQAWLHKAEQREVKRWTLQEWLAQKERNKLMDMWLAMNSASPFEFSLGISQNDTQVTTYNNLSEELLTQGEKSKGLIYKINLSAFADKVGIEAEYEKNPLLNYNDQLAMLSFRLFGNSIQSSYLMFHYGLKNHYELIERIQQQFMQISAQIYITKFFGFNSYYRDYVSTTHETYGKIRGYKFQYGIFIDYQALRIFGETYQETQYQELNSTKIQSQGILSGIKIFF